MQGFKASLFLLQDTYLNDTHFPGYKLRILKNINFIVKKFGQVIIYIYISKLY